MTDFSFEEQNSDPIQKQGTLLVLKYLSEQGFEVRNVSEDKNYFESGADIIILYPDGIEKRDVKTDKWLARTGNIAFELIEIFNIGGLVKLGWGFKDNIIDYLDWENKILYTFLSKDIRNFVFSDEGNKSIVKSFQCWHPNKKYYTIGFLLKIENIKKLCKVIQI